MAQAEQDERAERREALAKARQTARRMLRSGSTPETVVERLRKDGLEAKVAARVVERADDRLQEELRGGAGGVCVQCSERLRSDAKFCEACGTKVPNEEELHWHRTQIEPHLIKGRKWIGGMAILYALGGVLFFVITESVLVLALNLVLAVIHVGLWHWAKSNLLPAAVTALVVFATVHLANAVLDPATMFSGIIIKVLFVVALTQTIRAALQVRSLRGARA